MEYRIFGDTLPAVSIRLQQGESIFTQSGGMAWMDENIQMETNMQGGLFKGIGRMFTGESLFMATYTSRVPNGEITIASTFPGSILPLEVAPGKEYVCQKSSFLCAQPSVNLSVAVNGIKGGLFGGEGFLMERLSGQGLAFIELDGSTCVKDLAPGEKIVVSTGNVAAYEACVTYSTQTVKGFKNIVFGGEGLFLTTLTGPGRVWLQTITMPGFAAKIIPFIPAQHS